MSKKITKIDFGFENCEVGTLPIKAVNSFDLDHIKKYYHHNWNCESNPDNELSVDISCERAWFRIDYELASKVKTNFMEADDKNNLAKRFLYWTNLSSVTLHYDDQSQEFIWLPYDEVNPDELFDTSNKFQSTKVVKDSPWEVGFNTAYKDHRMIIVEVDSNRKIA